MPIHQRTSVHTFSTHRLVDGILMENLPFSTSQLPGTIPVRMIHPGTGLVKAAKSLFQRLARKGTLLSSRGFLVVRVIQPNGSSDRRTGIRGQHAFCRGIVGMLSPIQGDGLFSECLFQAHPFIDGRIGIGQLPAVDDGHLRRPKGFHHMLHPTCICGGGI